MYSHDLSDKGGDGDGHMTVLMKEEEVVSTSLASTTSEVISQPMMHQETISIKSNFQSHCSEQMLRGRVLN